MHIYTQRGYVPLFMYDNQGNSMRRVEDRSMVIRHVPKDPTWAQDNKVPDDMPEICEMRAAAKRAYIFGHIGEKILKMYIASRYVQPNWRTDLLMPNGEMYPKPDYLDKVQPTVTGPVRKGGAPTTYAGRILAWRKDKEYDR